MPSPRYPESMTNRPPTETELKVPVDGLGPVRRRLEALGAQLVHPSEREVNVLLDTPGRDLADSGRVLRLRAIGDRRRLTLKGRATFDGNIKTREELEIEVGDIDTLQAIFQRLGFRPVLRYEKDRETWTTADVTVTLDHTPMGDFVELEGPADQLVRTAGDLGVNADDAVRDSYPGLWRAHRVRHPQLDLPEDMVFPP